jgi:hypothetical protein
MRITKQALVRRWTLCTVAAVIVFAVLAWSDWRLKALSGVGTADLQGFNTAVEYRWAFLHWPARFAVRAGFDWVWIICSCRFTRPPSSIPASWRGRPSRRVLRVCAVS